MLLSDAVALELYECNGLIAASAYMLRKGHQVLSATYFGSSLRRASSALIALVR